MKFQNRIIVIAAWALCGLQAKKGQTESPRAAGAVKLIKGDVIILDARGRPVADTSGKLTRRLEIGSAFYVSETVETRADGRVKLEFVEGGPEGKNEVTLGTGTSLLIERVASGGTSQSGTSLSLARGEVRSIVNKKYSGSGGDVYEVKTPNAVAGVRGTIFLARFNPQTRRSDIATERGLVSVKSAGVAREVVVQPGMYTSASPGAAPIPPAPISSNGEISGVLQSMSVSSDSSSAGSGSASSSPTASEGAKSDSPKSDAVAEGSAPEKKKENRLSSGEPSRESNQPSGEAAGGSGAVVSTTPSASSGGMSGGAAPLGREPVMADLGGGDGRNPASSGGASPAAGMPAMKRMNPMMNASPMAEMAGQAMSRNSAMMSTVNQTVNQTQQQVKTREAKAIIRIQ